MTNICTILIQILRNSASSFHRLSSSIFTVCSFVVVVVCPSRIVTSPLISLKSKNFKKQKTKCIYFFNFGSGWPPTPSQLVPKPFNWSPNTVFNRYLSNGRSYPKISKNKVHLFFNFGSGGPPHTVNWSPSHSTGPQTPF